MKVNASNIEEYIEKVPADKKKAVEELRKVVKKNIPKGFKEELSYGSIGFVIPHSLFPHGYHCNPELPLPFINIAAKKNYISLHHMGVYADKKLLDWFVKEYPKHSKSKLDMGKACIRFKKVEDIPYKLIGELTTKVTAEKWMEVCSKYAKK